MQEVQYQCKSCGGIMSARDRRAHLNTVHQHGADAFNARQAAACFTTTIDPMHPGRAAKWGYTDDEIRRVIPGLEPINEEEHDGATESRPGRA